nr:acetyl-CoA acetyltransferase [Raoultella sp. NCTC 9187]
MIFGCANQAGEDNRNVAHMATLLAGYPQSVSGTTINRLWAPDWTQLALPPAPSGLGTPT